MNLTAHERKLILTSLLYTIRRSLEAEKEGLSSWIRMTDDFIDIVWEHFPEDWPAMETIASTPEVGYAILRRGGTTGRPVVEMILAGECKP